jgi:hypothetical protein
MLQTTGSQLAGWEGLRTARISPDYVGPVAINGLEEFIKRETMMVGARRGDRWVPMAMR